MERKPMKRPTVAEPKKRTSVETKKKPTDKKPSSKDTTTKQKPDDVKRIVFGILDNASYVLDACKCKTIMPAHLVAIAMVQNTITKNRIGRVPVTAVKKGGAQVLPSEYFGVDSGRYFDISEVSKLETNMFSDAALARAELPLKVGGALNKVSLAMLKQAVKDYNQARKKSVKISKEAMALIKTSVELNLK